MPRSRPPYPPEFREQMVALVRSKREVLLDDVIPQEPFAPM